MGRTRGFASAHAEGQATGFRLRLPRLSPSESTGKRVALSPDPAPTLRLWQKRCSPRGDRPRVVSVSFFFSFKFGLRQKFGKASLHKAAWQRTRAGGEPPPTRRGLGFPHTQHPLLLLPLNPIKEEFKKKKKAVFQGSAASERQIERKEGERRPEGTPKGAPGVCPSAGCPPPRRKQVARAEGRGREHSETRPLEKVERLYLLNDQECVGFRSEQNHRL